MKRAILIFLSALMIVCSLPVSAYAASAPAAPKVTAASNVNTVTLKWKKIKGASGYDIYSYNKKKYKKIGTSKKLKYTVKKLTAATGYVYAVRAFKKVGTKKKYSKYSKLVKVATLPKPASGLYSKKVSFATASLGWNSVKGATSYTVNYSTDTYLKSNVKTATSNTNSIIIRELADNTSYYYTVTAVVNYAGKSYKSKASDKAIFKTEKIPADKRTTLKTSTTYQTVDGFGTSAAWNYQLIGGWNSADTIMKYLYDGNTGIGLNIYRYNVGTGSRDDSNIPDYYRRTDSFIKSIDTASGTIQYDFTKDAEAQNCLKLAKKYAGSNLRLTLFHNSPPIQLTKNGKAFGDDNGESLAENMESNLAPENYRLYTKYCIDVADYFVKSGYRVTDVSPMNEPIYSWTGSNQEGCHYTPAQASQLFSIMASLAKNKTYKISMFEAGAAEDGIENGEKTVLNRYLAAIMSDKTNSNYFDTVSIHSYWSDKNRKALCKSYIDSTYPGMKIACTEYCQMYEDWSTGVHDISAQNAGTPEANGLGITYGLEMARTVYEDLTVLNCTEWDWWLGVSCGYYPDGLIYVDHDMTDETVIQTSKRMWCLGNFSKFIEEGAVRCAVTTVEDKLLSCAFINKNGSIVIVFINRTANDVKTNICLNGYTKYKAYETSASRNLALTSQGDFENGKAVNIPKESVVSVIVTK